MLWGVENGTHVIAGTSFAPATAKMGNEPLETWLLRLLSPRIDFRFHAVMADGRRIVLLEIDRASRQPVSFSGTEFVRVGSTKRRLKDYPERERTLWRVFDRVRFEEGIAAERMSAEDVLLKLDYPAYFDLLDLPLPDGHAAILDVLQQDRLIAPCAAGGFDITNPGAMLLAKNLGDFRSLQRKAVRVIEYRGAGRTETLKELEALRGYAAGFESLLVYINARLPASEIIGPALRQTIPAFPEIAVRELVANSLIHQDFLATGAGPMVEIFPGRIEITNPGEPLVDTQRFLDSPPRSRNEVLASLILFARKPLAKMDMTERERACYLRQYDEHIDSRALRDRGEEPVDSVALDPGGRRRWPRCRPFPEAPPKYREYVPFWASSDHSTAP